MTTVPGDFDPTEAPLTNGAYYAATLFDRHGVAVRAERTRLVQTVLDLEYRAAHRRVRGEFPFTIEELAKLAGHFGETLNELFATAAAASADSGTFVCGSLRVACKFWPGPVIEQPAPNSLVAYRQGWEWVISPASESSGSPLHAVKQVLLDAQGKSRQRIAVLDDDRDITDSVCQYLKRLGYQADPFHSVDALAKAALERAYDAYVLDWLVGKDNVGELIGALRADAPGSVMAVLTGQAESGRAAGAIAEALASYDVLFFQKPVPLPILVAQITRRLAGGKS
jgi:CheY-like chemotaxis protein